MSLRLNEVKGSHWETSSLSHCFFFFCNIIPIITLTLFYLFTDQLDIPDSNSVAMWTEFVWLTDHPAGISLTTTTPVTRNNSNQQHIGQDKDRNVVYNSQFKVPYFILISSANTSILNANSQIREIFDSHLPQSNC